MVESVVISILFLASIGYLLNSLRKHFNTKSMHCAKGCGSGCSSIDFEKIEAEVVKKEALSAKKTKPANRSFC